jgi:hypothetical protein
VPVTLVATGLLYHPAIDGVSRKALTAAPRGT